MHPLRKNQSENGARFNLLLTFVRQKPRIELYLPRFFLDVETLLMVSFQCIDPPNQNSTSSYLRTTQFHFYAEVHYR